MTESIIEFVRIGEDDIQAVRGPDGEGYVVLKRMCEALGIAEQRQAEKLKSASWAVTTLVVATAADGKNYKCFCLHIKSVPMWLATINSSRVAEHARPKIELFQRDAADALYRWATGSDGHHEIDMRNDAQRLVAFRQVIAMYEEARQKIIKDAPKVEGYDELINTDGLRGLQEAGKALGLKPRSFTKLLEKEGYIFRTSNDNLMPNQRYKDLGYFEVRSFVKNGESRSQAFVTRTGLDYFWRKFCSQSQQLSLTLPQ